jgi:hypothetical protein
MAPSLDEGREELQPQKKVEKELFQRVINSTASGCSSLNDPLNSTSIGLP